MNQKKVEASLIMAGEIPFTLEVFKENNDVFYRTDF